MLPADATGVTAPRDPRPVSGLEKILEYKLDDDEKAMFDTSAAAVKETHEALKKLVAL